MEMEEEENNISQKTFESFNLNPQDFINEVLNLFDDCLDNAFHDYLKEATNLLQIEEDTEKHAELSRGVNCVKELIHLDLDKRLQNWEDYCLRCCFRVPDDFSLPENNEAAIDDLAVKDFLADTCLDSELKSVREKIAQVEKETAQLARQVDDLEEQSLSNNRFAGAIDEVVHLYKAHNTSQVVQELATLAPVLRSKLNDHKRKVAEDIERERFDKIHSTDVKMCLMHIEKGLFGGRKPEEMVEFFDGMMRPR